MGICQECRRPNPVWYAPNEVWNLVMGGPEAEGDPGGMLCPNCFIARAETTGVVAPTAWVLRPETPADYPAERRPKTLLEKVQEACRRPVSGDPCPAKAEGGGA